LEQQKKSSLLLNLVYIPIVLWNAWAWYAHASLGFRANRVHFIWVLIGVSLLFLNYWVTRALGRQRQTPLISRQTQNVPPTVKKQQQAAARKILDRQKALYSLEPHHHKVVDASAFPELDHEFYDRVRTTLEARGFRFLGDRENLTLTATFPNRRFFIRSMVSGDETILAGVHHIKTKARGFAPNIRTIEFETELSSGAFLTTSNALEAARTLPVPNIHALKLPAETSIDELLQAHTQKLAEIMERDKSVTATRIETMDDCIAFQHRMHAIKAKHKQAIGFVGVEDLKKVRGRELNEYEKGVAAEIENLKTQKGSVKSDNEPQ
jgi:hypothetical protein